MYALNLDKETRRILSVTFEQFAAEGQPLVETLPDGDVSDYLYADGEYTYDPRPKTETPEDPEVDLVARVAELEEQLAATKILLGVE